MKDKTIPERLTILEKNDTSVTPRLEDHEGSGCVNR